MITRFFFFPALLITASSTSAVEGPAEEALPTSYPVTRYSSIWENSPFNREVIKPVKTNLTNNFGRNMVLQGLIIDSQQGPIAYVFDSKENKTIRITSQGSNYDLPYTIVSADKQADPKGTKVIITDGQEEAEITYEENALTASIRAPQQQARSDNRKQPPAGNAAARVREQQQRNQEAAKRAQQNSGSSPASRPAPPASAPKKPENVDPLDKIDDAPRRRSVPLPKGVGGN
ncbi:MAG: hypothetical protein MI807_10675 [Verrucomicrobiales bacterium]|nr:hypothetical protein [Verrucomicrobiales bacterium]